MTLTTSWKLTLFLYAFSMALVVIESFTGISFTETQYQFILGMLGLTTVAGTSNAVFSNKEKIKQLIQELKSGVTKT